MMNLQALLEYLSTSDTIGENKDAVDMMRFYSREAQKITMKINTAYHEPDEIIALLSELTGKPVDPSFRLFPPFYTDFGKNILKKLGVEGDYEGIGHCAIGYAAEPAKDPVPRKADYVYYI